MQLDRTIVDLLVLSVDTSLQGSEYGIEAWKLLKEHLLQDSDEETDTHIPLDDLIRLEELVDRAIDDIKGVGFRIDLSLDRLYG